MNKANSVYQYEQPKLPEGWNESERRFYNRLIQVLDDIYSKYGRIDEKMLSKTVINKIENATVLTLEKMIANVVSAGSIAADSIEATFADMVSLSAKYGSYDFETVKNLVADALVLEKGQAGTVHITNLVATYAQAVSATVGSLCIKASDGQYYRLDVNPDGTITGTATNVSPEEEAAGETDDGKVIIGTSISAAELTTDTLYGTQALLNKITAESINVDTLIARESFIQKLVAAEAFVDALVTADISSNTTIKLIAGKADKAVATVRTLYAQNDSTVTVPVTGWSESAPARQEGKYIWQKTETVLNDGTVKSSEPTCISGADGEKGEAGSTPAIWTLAGQISAAQNGSVKITLYKDGVQATEPAYLVANVSSGGGAWREHGSSMGSFTGTKSWSFGGDAKGIAWRCDVYADSTRANLLASCLVYAGAKGDQGSPGDDGASIVSSTRYYLLQSSELDAPSVPTTNPPGDSWIDTEPVYDVDVNAMDIMYFVDLTTFSDGSFAYSALSLSASFAAAKQAYNKASDAQDAANNAGSIANAAVQSIGDIPNYVEIKGDGLYLKDEQGASTLKLNSGSVNIGTVTGQGKGFSQFAASYAQFGNYQMRRTADGGLAFMTV